MTVYNIYEVSEGFVDITVRILEGQLKRDLVIRFDTAYAGIMCRHNNITQTFYVSVLTGVVSFLVWKPLWFYRSTTATELECIWRNLLRLLKLYSLRAKHKNLLLLCNSSLILQHSFGFDH